VEQKKIKRQGTTRPWQNTAEPATTTKTPTKAEASKNLFQSVLHQVGRLTNDYTARGIEKIPHTGPALMVHNGTEIPLHAWFFDNELATHQQRQVFSLEWQEFINHHPASILFKPLTVYSPLGVGSRELLSSGQLVSVTVDGMMLQKQPQQAKTKRWNELFYYGLESALATKTPVIPVYTHNSELLYKTPLARSWLMRTLRRTIRLPLKPFWGLGPLPFPVKLISIVGEPITPKTDSTIESLGQEIIQAINTLKEESGEDISVIEALRSRWKQEKVQP
jgi:hypothetical protein